MKKVPSILTAILLAGCASMVTPSGGKKDEKSPILQKTNLKSTEFKDAEIRLIFDENVQLENYIQNITIQPRHSTFKATAGNHTVRIKLDSALHQNTTYVLNIENGIKDVNEGNPFSYQYQFSTGKDLDTNTVTYKIKNYSLLKNLKLGLCRQHKDTLQQLYFDYLYKVTSDVISLKGLGQQIYYCWIFTDNNNDDHPDDYSPVYYDTLLLNTEKNITVNEWTDYRNTKTRNYRNYTKIYKPLCDDNSYDLQQIIYTDKDSSLFYQHNSDTLQELKLATELKNIMTGRYQAIKNSKEYLLILDKCGIRNIKPQITAGIQEDNNFIYISSKNRIDSIFLQLKLPDDSITFLINKIKYTESIKISTVKIAKNNKNEDIIMAVYSNKKLQSIKKINRKNDVVLYMQPGTYQFKFYNTNSFLKTSFNLKNLERINCAVIEKEITLKPNWDEDLQIIF